jgi:hypothetical protein
MRRWTWLLVLAAGCTEPPKTGQMVQTISGLAHLHSWDPTTQGRGQYAYDAVMGWGPEIVPSLVATITDETPTAIHDDLSGRTVPVGDVCFLMALQISGHRWEEFFDDGVFVSTALENPIFCIRWKDRASRFRVQSRFFSLLPPPE